jgi:hypothetical protein
MTCERCHHRPAHPLYANGRLCEDCWVDGQRLSASLGNRVGLTVASVSMRDDHGGRLYIPGTSRRNVHDLY